MVVRGSACRGGDLDVAEVDAGVEHGGDEGVPQHVWVHPWQPDPAVGGEGVQASGGGVPVHPRPASGPQDGTRGSFPVCVVDGPAYRGREGGEDDLAALAGDPQHPVAVFFTEVVDVRAAGFEDPQTQKSEHGDEGEVVGVRREPGGGEHRFELQVVSPRVGDSGGTFGRRTCSAGEDGRTPSMTQVR